MPDGVDLKAEFTLKITAARKLAQRRRERVAQALRVEFLGAQRDIEDKARARIHRVPIQTHRTSPLHTRLAASDAERARHRLQKRVEFQPKLRELKRLVIDQRERKNQIPGVHLKREFEQIQGWLIADLDFARMHALWDRIVQAERLPERRAMKIGEENMAGQHAPGRGPIRAKGRHAGLRVLEFTLHDRGARARVVLQLKIGELVGKRDGVLDRKSVV